jgi:hypothetical protein
MGRFSALIGRRSPTTWAIVALVGAIAVATVLLVGMQAAFAASLPGSQFEIDTDANLKVDNLAPSFDWANVSETRKADLASGGGDDSFGQGTKEDTAVPTVVSGSIPPNKSDLLNFGVYLETTPSGARFDKHSKILHLGYALSLTKAQNGVVGATRGENGNRYTHTER